MNVIETLNYWDHLYMVCYRQRRCPSLVTSFINSIGLAGLLFMVSLVVVLAILLRIRIARHQAEGGTNDNEGGLITQEIAFINKAFPSVAAVQKLAEQAEERAERAEASLAVVSTVLLRAGLLKPEEAAELEKQIVGEGVVERSASAAQDQNEDTRGEGGSSRSGPVYHEGETTTTYGAVGTDATTRFRSAARSRGDTRDMQGDLDADRVAE